MTVFHAICLGIIQGITEFLPVSSSTHLMVFSQLMGLPNQRHSLDIFLNLGTLAAVSVYFFPDIAGLFRGFCDLIKNKKSENRNAFFVLFFSTLPTVIFFGIAEAFFDINFQSYILISVSLIFFAIILWRCDTRPEAKDKFTMKDGIIVGTSQVVSIIPGVSRLGACFSAARYLHYSRQESFKFSMILSIPVVFGACLIKLLKVFMGKIIIESWSFVFIGSFFSFVVGLMALRFMTYFLEKHTFFPFVIYRIVFAMLLLGIRSK